MTGIDPLLTPLLEKTRELYRANGRIKSFNEFFESLKASPYSLSRNAPQYIVDMLEYFGVEESLVLGEPAKRFKLFDAPFGQCTDQALMGQEETVLAVYEALKNFVTEGRADRMIHLHGPNGSSKSLIVELLMRGCKAYSLSHEGALYSFSWVFPKSDEVPTLGFGSHRGGSAERAGDAEESYAHLPSDKLDVVIPCELGDSPLFLIPKTRRMEILRALLDEAPENERRRFFSTYRLQNGDLCPRCRMIYDALLQEYNGDSASILKHVQVRRLFLSRRYRRGAVTVSPQQTPDAGSRQITLDSSLKNLPTALQHLNLTHLYGDLVDANNGLVEFSDFLTRAAELNKYLLSATERSELSLESANLYLNLVLFATSNERHLDTFKESPDFASFKGRMILITVPYLLERQKEESIYEIMLKRIGRNKHIAPHVAFVVALWAILTRLNRPTPDHFPEDLRSLAAQLTPLEKARIYAGEAPSHDDKYTPRRLRTLKELLPLMRDEYRDTPIYEGRFGASPRELREILYSAALRPSNACLTPMEVFDELGDFLKDKSLYLFLQLKVDGGYHDAEAALGLVRGEYLRFLEREIYSAMEFMPEGEYENLFVRYFTNVRAALSGKDVYVPATGKREEPDAELMAEIEEYLGIADSPKHFRENLLGRVAAWTLENPEEELDLSTLFSSEIAKLSKSFTDKNADRVEAVGRALLSLGTPGFKAVPPPLREAARATLNHLITRFGYCPNCAPHAVAFFLEHKFGTQPKSAI